ncbi:aldo-keto reductase [Irpex rosettiformis]|uniref:Aldo-keto reductase n=1 Tax=Irpex rosettiformis TaxID=378272 RepID=A0ACB8U7V0_9APHY|nr:aldo-keto reductase [Irpex rosettiformis]
MAFNLQSRMKLRDGSKIPILGFGTYELEGSSVIEPLTWALDAGYRHIDGATWYYNEKECGQAIHTWLSKTGTPRSEIFWTTKLKDNISYDATMKAIDASLSAIGFEYIDLYLLHSAIGGPEIRKECWRAACDAKKQGKVKSIGVSNFGVKHIQEMLEQGVELPVLNQVDLHPFMTRTDIVEICQKHDIALEAWGPLVRGLRFKHPSIVSLAEKYHKSAAQVLLRYSIQKGFIPIPKSASRERIISNTQIYNFELSEDEMKHLDSLDEALITDWEVTTCP